MVVFSRARCRLAGLALVLLLTACGGGGGGGSAGSGPGAGTASISVPARSRAVTTHHDTVLNSKVAVGFSVANAPREGYYLSVDSPSPLVADVQFEDISDTAGAVLVELVPGDTAGAGVYPVRLDLGFCVDEACQQHLPGSPVTVQITYDVRAEHRKVRLALTPPAPVRGLLSDATGPVARAGIQVFNPPVEGIRFETLGGSSLVLSSSVTAAGGAYEGRFLLAPPASVGLGEHRVSPRFAVCFGDDCSKARDVGEPKVDLSYTVTAVPIQDVRTLVLRLTDLIWDPLRSVIVMAVDDPGRSGNANRGFLDPRTGGYTLHPGAGPMLEHLALSPDGQRLYASQRGGSMLYRYRRDDLGLVDQAFVSTDPDDDSSDGLYIQDLQFGPDGTLAMLAARQPALNRPVNSAELRLLDGLSLRPQRLVAGTEPLARAFCSQAWAEDGSEILVSATTREILRLAVDASGLAPPTETAAALSCLDGMQLAHGRLLARNGLVLDAATGALAGRLGTEAGTSGAVQDVVVDRAQDRVYVLHTVSTDESGDSRITAYSAQTLAPLDSVLLRAAGQPTRMIRWGIRGLALTNPRGEILLLDGGVADLN